MTWVALFIWPLVAAILFKMCRLPVALLGTFIGGYLLLPTQVGIDLPVLPPLNKDTIPAFTALLLALVYSRTPQFRPAGASPDWPVLPGLLPRDMVVLTLFLLLFIGHIGTHAVNASPVFYGPVMLPGLRPYDALSAMLFTFLNFIPFLLGRKVLSSIEGQRLLLTAMALSAAVYAFLALYEVRMSPQLNRMLYGFFPHDWSQHRRGSSWRPVVFLQHGLQLSIFFTIAVVSAAVMMTVDDLKKRMLWGLMTFWLFFVLVMSKSLGALLIAIVVLGVVFFLPKRLQILFIFSVTTCLLLYPVVRSADILPYDRLLSAVSGERAFSLNYRLENEQLLLNKANERPLFGWGGWGRSRVYDSETGVDISTPDGAWIIWLGLGGWIRYIATFGLLSWGMLQLFWQRGKHIDRVTVGLALVLTANLVDLIPNAGISPVTWLIAGALCGRLERGAAPEPRSETVVETAPDPGARAGPVYARDFSPPQVQKDETPVERDAVPYRRSFESAKRT